MIKRLTTNIYLKLFALILAIMIYHSLKNSSSTDSENDRTFFKYFKY